MASQNVLYERYRFYQRCQQNEETLQYFVNDVRELAKDCAFSEHTEFLVRDRIVFGMQNEDFKWRIINNGGDPTLSDILNACHRFDNDLKDIDIKVNTVEHCEVKMETEDMIESVATDPVMELTLRIDANSEDPITTVANEHSTSSENNRKKTSKMVNLKNIACPVCDKLYSRGSLRFHMQTMHSKSENTLPKAMDLADVHMPESFRGNDESDANTKNDSQEEKMPLTLSSFEKMPCPLCGKMYAPISIRSHLEKVHKTYNEKWCWKKCHICNKMVSLKTILAHMQRHIDQVRRRGGYLCSCTKEFVYQQQLEDHLEEHTEIDPATKQKVYKCVACMKSYGSIKSIRVHFSSKHRRTDAVTPQFKCIGCNLTFRRERELRRHNRQHVQCDTCQQYFTSSFTLKRHVLTHDPNVSYECFSCHRSFAVFKHMQTHRRLCRPDVKFECPVCHKCLLNSVTLQKHMEIHADKSILYCEKCERSYTTREGLHKHMQAHRQCSVCRIDVLGDDNLRYHMIEHIENSEFECLICHQKYRTFNQVKRHMPVAHSGTVRVRTKNSVSKKPVAKNHLCPQCGARYAHASLLRHHLMRDDHQVAGGSGFAKQHKCNECDRRFSSISDFNNHMRRHTGQTPCQCEFCGKAFPCKITLYEHRMGVHLQRDRHKCTVCNYTCYKSFCMKKHMLTHRKS